ncbi:DUF397 domain-containing protein [Streptomyces sp. NBC_00569]|uniref:DUF397 domain-containing protein n=1 Tax=unclassified Streptomyces TaxID=2593676 RepID=UPI00225831B3|nr:MULTISPECIES: DUF397 domain-containing protein [unclassified Streptomyces]MCX5439206.1 DUF397 domain-containing protein [Streptomyces sp. NBC_00063]WUB94313.1 DUF397 domain-containing protein [Streptomyces sp. NBC_00569]
MTHSSSEQQWQGIRVPDASALPMWRKSSYSGGESGQCLEVNDHACAAHVPVRDSKNPHGPAVVFTSGAWTAFLGAMKAAADRPRR